MGVRGRWADIRAGVGVKQGTVREKECWEYGDGSVGLGGRIVIRFCVYKGRVRGGGYMSAR